MAGGGRGWNSMIFKVPSNPKPFCGSMKAAVQAKPAFLVQQAPDSQACLKEKLEGFSWEKDEAIRNA